MTVETLHAPGGTNLRPNPRFGEFPCPKCPFKADALCVLLEHARKTHGENLVPLMR